MPFYNYIFMSFMSLLKLINGIKILKEKLFIKNQIIYFFDNF